MTFTGLSARATRRGDADAGFSLIELLVVIIIIGILAGIAIPVFLNQRRKGYDAQAKSDVRNMATAEETYLTQSSAGYTSDITVLQGLGWKLSANSSNPQAIAHADKSYCLSVQAQSGTTWYFDSSVGAPSTTACT